MNTVTEQAQAKLNLSLDVLGKRSDGYHDLRMVMQSVELCDAVTVEPRPAGGFVCESNFGFLPTDGDNLAARAAQVFFAAAGSLPVIANQSADWCGDPTSARQLRNGIPTPVCALARNDRTGTVTPGAAIRLDKRIPVGAGMAGGSSDAAAVLRALNRMYGNPFTLEELERLGEQVGSDVPYCVRGGTRLAEGRGELLTELPPLPDCAFAICKPDFSIRTPELFARIDARTRSARPDTEGLRAALAAGDLRGVARHVFNVFEDVLSPSQSREITAIKTALLDRGALGAAMTGTGSAVFGIFHDFNAAKAAAEDLKPPDRACFAAKPTGMIWERKA